MKEKENQEAAEAKSTPEVQEEKVAQPEVKPETKEVKQQPDLAKLEKELAELRAFKAQVEAKQTQVKEDIPVMDSFLSRGENLAKTNQATKAQQQMEELLEKGGFYRPQN